MEDDIEVITIVRDSKPMWKATQKTTGISELGLTPSMARNNLRTKISKLWRVRERKV